MKNLKSSIWVFILFNSICFYSLNSKEYKYLFDDFNYPTINIFNNIDSSGSMFSRNIWKSDKGDTAIKAWFKANYDPKEFPENEEILLSNKGFILKIKSCLLPKGTMQPFIMSSFFLEYGTYTTMCKFSQFHINDRITQAFFLINPLSFTFYFGKSTLNYCDEIDYEWNNWWEGDNAYLMAVGSTMKNHIRPSQMYLNCIMRDSIGNTANLLQGNIPFTGKSAMADRWGLCIFVLDSIKNQTKFGVYFPDNGEGYELWAGDNFEWGNYYIIHDYTMYNSKVVYYTIGTAIPEVHAESPYEVDWFYYDERTDIDYPEILKIVSKFKSKKIDRIYNGDIFFNEIMTPFNKDKFSFIGDTIIEPDKEYKWYLKSECKRWYCFYDIKEMNYRFHNKSGYWEDWNPLITIEPSLKAASYQDSLEIFTSFTEHWNNYQDSARIKIYIKGDEKKDYNIIHDMQIFPNPFKEYSLITYSISEDNDIRIKIVDLIGNEVYYEDQFKKSGKHTLELSNINLDFGFYTCMIYTKNQVVTAIFFRR